MQETGERYTEARAALIAPGPNATAGAGW
jgi:hypothetical protein